MERNEVLDVINTIGTCEDEGERRTLLDSLRDEINGVYDENENLTNQNNDLVQANESLRSTNMDMFLQLGEQKSKKDIIKNETGSDSEPEPRKFEDLFNDKGELK